MANEIKEFLARQVIERRKNAKLSQAALSRQTKLSIARISEIERGIANPTLDTLEALAGAFGISVVDLLDYEGTISDPIVLKTKIENNLSRFDEVQLRTVLSLVRVMRK